MNEYGSHVKPKIPTTLIAIHTITNTVMYAMNRAVPMNRANISAKGPNVSPVMCGSRTRCGSRGRSSRACRRGSAIAVRHRIRVPVPPVARQQVVEDVVDGHRADQPVVPVHHRQGDQVVGD